MYNVLIEAVCVLENLQITPNAAYRRPSRRLVRRRYHPVLPDGRGWVVHSRPLQLTTHSDPLRPCAIVSLAKTTSVYSACHTPPPPAVLPSHSLVRSPMRERDRSATGPAHLHHRRIHHRESEVGDANNVGRSSDRALRQIPMGRAPMVGRHRGGSDRWVGAWEELPGPARCHSRRQ